MINDLINKKAVIQNFEVIDKKDALKKIAQHLKRNGFIEDSKQFNNDLLEREKQFSTGVGNAIAMPHAQSDVVKTNVVFIAKLKKQIDWEFSDGKKVKYIFCIALNKKDKHKQVDVLQHFSKALLNEKTNKNLHEAKTIDDLMEAFVYEEDKPVEAVNQKKVIAVTACPTGIAHTYMAAEFLYKAAQELKVNIKVETQGRKIDNHLTDEDIASADAIILAIDKAIDGMERFDGKKVLKANSKKAIHHAKALIEEALAGEGEVIKVKKTSSTETNLNEYSWAQFKNVYKNLMGGVSRMLPFVVAGGILLGIAFLIDSGNSGGALGSTRDAAKWFAGLGKVAFGAFVPILGAYVAYSIVGSEGLMPGMVAGFIASGGGILYSGFANGNVVTGAWSNMWGQLTPTVDQDVLSVGSGFLGAMVGGYIAAMSVVLVRKYIFRKVHKNLRGVVDIIGIPVSTILLTGAIMLCMQIPLAYAAFGMKKLVKLLNEYNILVVLTIILAGMMAVDMGGPINKVAYVIGTGGIANGTQQDYITMAAVMVGGMVPPITLAFSTLIWKRKAWSETDIEAGKANWVLGLGFITEGAIPFAARDPKRTIPCLILASAISGAAIGALQIGVSAPHGGIIVAALFKSYLFDSSSVQQGVGIALMLAVVAVSSLIGGFVLGAWRRHSIKKQKLVIA